MSLIDRATIQRFHLDRIAEFGGGNIRSLGWLSPESQQVRFEALASLGDMSSRTVLDVGCGHADLYPYLSERYPGIRYIGLDQMENFLEVASQRYGNQPQVQFLKGDFWNSSLPEADYVIACGALSYRHSEPDFLRKMIKKLYNNAKIALGFTLLRHVDPESILVAHQPKQVRDYCRDLCAKVQLKLTYHSEDFAVFMRK